MDLCCSRRNFGKLNLLHIFRLVTAGESAISYCIEKWSDYKKGRLFYSVFTLVLQFILPLTLISLAHSAIKRKLRNLPTWKRPEASTHRKPLMSNNANQDLQEPRSDENPASAADVALQVRLQPEIVVRSVGVIVHVPAKAPQAASDVQAASVNRTAQNVDLSPEFKEVAATTDLDLATKPKNTLEETINVVSADKSKVKGFLSIKLSKEKLPFTCLLVVNSPYP